MNAKGEICIGMAGAGRATELHMNALNRYTGVPVCYKHIIARRYEQVNRMKDRYGFKYSLISFNTFFSSPRADFKPPAVVLFLISSFFLLICLGVLFCLCLYLWYLNNYLSQQSNHYYFCLVFHNEIDGPFYFLYIYVCNFYA